MVDPLNAAFPTSGHPFRFPRQFRLKSPHTIRAIMQDGTSHRRRWDAFRLIWPSRSEATADVTPRFAFVISRDAGPAVVRNRIKRRLREAVRLAKSSWPAAPVPIILRINSDRAAQLSFAELQSQVHQALADVKRHLPGSD